MINFSKKLGVPVRVALALLMIVSPLAAQVQASNSGLRVIVYVHNVPSWIVGQEAGMTVTSNSDISLHRAVIIPDASSFYTQLRFGSGEVAVGEKISGCVYISENLNYCSYTWNSKNSKPERIDIYLPRSNNNNFDSTLRFE